jgi:hypothetical protein
MYDMCEPSYRAMGDNFGGGKQRATGWCVEMTEKSNKWGDKAHL